MNKRKNKTLNRKIVSSSVSVIISLSLVLFVLGLLSLFLINAQRLTNYVKENVGFSIMINDNIKELAATIIKVSKNRYRENKQENSILNQIGEVCFFILCTFIIYLIWHIILHYLGLVN